MTAPDSADMPETIIAGTTKPYDYRLWTPADEGIHADNGTKYTRADIADTLAAALEGVVRVADRKTSEFDAARKALELYRGRK